MGDVHVIPGVERRDLLDTIVPRDLLNKANHEGVTDVTIIGRDRAGKFYLSSCLGDADKTVGMLYRAITLIAGATFDAQ